MNLTYRPIVTWPGPRTDKPKPSPFEASWSDTLWLLEKELWFLGVREAILQVDSPNERDFRLDGQLRSNAKLRSGAVIISVDSPKHGKLQYPCDTFVKKGYRDKLEDWQCNVRAIALGLEALRKLARYGIANTGQQYRGWRAIGPSSGGQGREEALGSGIPMPAKTEMTVEEARRFLREQSEWAGSVNWNDALTVREMFRRAAKRLHPDAGGDPELFKQLTIAKETLERFA